MLSSVRSQALLVVLASVIVSVGVAACPTPTTAFIDPGGKCIDPWFGAPYCSEPQVTQNGGCNGPNTATKKCTSVRTIQDWPKWNIKYPTLTSCENNACEPTGPNKELRFTYAYLTDDNCTTASNQPCDSAD